MSRDTLTSWLWYLQFLFLDQMFKLSPPFSLKDWHFCTPIFFYVNFHFIVQFNFMHLEIGHTGLLWLNNILSNSDICLHLERFINKNHRQRIWNYNFSFINPLSCTWYMLEFCGYFFHFIKNRTWVFETSNPIFEYQ